MNDETRELSDDIERLYDELTALNHPQLADFATYAEWVLAVQQNRDDRARITMQVANLCNTELFPHWVRQTAYARALFEQHAASDWRIRNS